MSRRALITVAATSCAVALTACDPSSFEVAVENACDEPIQVIVEESNDPGTDAAATDSSWEWAIRARGATIEPGDATTFFLFDGAPGFMVGFVPSAGSPEFEWVEFEGAGAAFVSSGAGSACSLSAADA